MLAPASPATTNRSAWSWSLPMRPGSGTWPSSCGAHARSMTRAGTLMGLRCRGRSVTVGSRFPTPKETGCASSPTGSRRCAGPRTRGMRVTDWLGDGGVWFHINGDHHVMALVDKGYSHLHHLAFDVVDIGQMRVALDHLGRHGRWLGWGPTRHGIGGNIASYVRIVEEECFVELYCDMEQLEAEHEPRRWPDDRLSSNTWGPLPPRSYFRFDAAAVASERESLEMLGQPLPEEVNA